MNKDERNKQEQFIDNVLAEFQEGKSYPKDFTYKQHLELGRDLQSITSFQDASHLNDVIIWDPLTVYPDLILTCVLCNGNDVLHQIRWIDGRNKFKQPRSLCSLTGETLLVSRTYTCKRKHQILSHDPSILLQTKEVLKEPFLLMHKSGVTRHLYNFVITHYNAGMNTSEVYIIWQQTLMDNYVDLQQVLCRSMKQCGIASTVQLHAPKQKQGCNLIRMCFLADYFENVLLYNKKMSLTTATVSLACDHTFKVAANIGFFSHGKWVKVYNSLFLLLNEDGVVLAWQLCKGEKFEQIEDMLRRVRQRLEKQGKKPMFFFVDNCCKWRNLLQQIFPDLLVKLDLFHGIQRIVTAIPKRSNDSIIRLLKQQMISSLRLILRDPPDQGEIRTLPTPTSQQIMENITAFERQWRDMKHEGKLIFPTKAGSELDKLKKHVLSGCLSGIPVSGGTSRNENVHKFINKYLKNPRLGVQMSVAALGTFFYRWNEKIVSPSRRLKVTKPIHFYCPELDPINDYEHFGTSCSLKSPRSTFMPLEDDVDIIDEDIAIYSDSDSESEESALVDDTVMEQSTMELDVREVAESCSNLLNLGEHIASFGESLKFKYHQMALYKSALRLLTQSFDNDNESSCSVDSILKPFKMKRLGVPKNGNDFFISIIHALLQLNSSSHLSTGAFNHLGTIGISLMNMQQDALNLRKTICQEWISNKSDYAPFSIIEDKEFDQQAELFEQNGYFAAEYTNILCLAASNILKFNFILFTPFDHFPIIPISFRGKIVNHHPILLALENVVLGHFDAVLAQPCCRCGEGGKRKLDTKLCDSYGSRCPCFRNVLGCTSDCKCKSRCGNLHNVELADEPSSSSQSTDRKLLPSLNRNRRAHTFSEYHVDGINFYRGAENREVKMPWSCSEDIVLTEVSRNLMSTDSQVICSWFNSVIEIIAKEGLNKRSPEEIMTRMRLISKNDSVFDILLSEQSQLMSC